MIKLIKAIFKKERVYILKLDVTSNYARNARIQKAARLN